MGVAYGLGRNSTPAPKRTFMEYAEKVGCEPVFTDAAEVMNGCFGGAV